MIAFVVSVQDPRRYEAIAAPGIETVREPDSLVLALPGEGALQGRLNGALDQLAEMPDLEAAVILHEDARLRDPGTASHLRALFQDHTVALAGPVGARPVRSLAWWEGMAVGRVAAPSGVIQGVEPPGDVAALDGVVLCLSPWAVRSLRFDMSLGADFHGYDVDLCFQARYHGRRVVAIDLDVYHDHRPLFGDEEAWVRNELRFQHRWQAKDLLGMARHETLNAPRAER